MAENSQEELVKTLSEIGNLYPEFDDVKIYSGKQLLNAKHF
ncbi:hypothetical protein [Pseudomonas moraviensis]|nr:hypothetical protein [Pseudomonas moraviensis]